MNDNAPMLVQVAPKEISMGSTASLPVLSCSLQIREVLITFEALDTRGLLNIRLTCRSSKSTEAFEAHEITMDLKWENNGNIVENTGNELGNNGKDKKANGI